MRIKESMASILHRMGVSANGLTVAGLLLAALSAFFIYKGSFIWAGLFLLGSGALDLLDGSVARLAGIKNSFGGILDSTLDRYGDGFILGAAALYFSARGALLYTGLALCALIGSFVVSYVRARAECEIDECKVGFWERGERIVYLALGLLLNNLAWVLWVLAVGTQATALFRLYQSKKIVSLTGTRVPESTAAGFISNFFFQTRGRRHAGYWIKITVWILAVVLIRIPS